MLWVVLLVIVLTGAYFYLKRHYNHFTNMGVKQTDPLWIFGDFLSFFLKRESFVDIALKIYNRARGLR